MGGGLLIGLVVTVVAGFNGALILLGLAAMAYGIINAVRASNPRRAGRSRRFAAAIAVAGLVSTGTGVALAEPAVDNDGPVAASPAPTSLAPDSPPPSAAPQPSEPASPEATPLPPSSSTEPQPERGTALFALAGLEVKGRAPKTGYDRDLFGSGWTDTNHNSCTTREDILRRDLRPVTVLAGTDGCEVTGGTLSDPYTSATLEFPAGGGMGDGGTGDDIEIEHIVALSDAWQKGAQQWSRPKRVNFANDALELLATGGAINAAKSDGDTATWLPPNKSYRCAYVARQVSIKAAYGLWVTMAEKAAMTRVLGTCSDQPVVTSSAAKKPKSASAEVRKREPDPAPKSEPEPEPPTDGSDDSDGSAHYANCTAVRAAGAAPIRRGEPGYSRKLDRDGDGVACE